MSIKVTGASGVEFELMNDEEKSYWNKALKRYIEQYKFENVADLQDLDRVLVGELLCHRWGSWLIREADYDGRAIDEIADKLYKQKLDQEKEVRLLKEKMGLNRARRQDSDSQAVHEYLAALKRRGKEFGVHRDTQIDKAINLIHEILTQVGMYFRTDEEEQHHLGITPLEIMKWINEDCREEFDAIDAAFRKNQKLWIKEVA